MWSGPSSYTEVLVPAFFPQAKLGLSVGSRGHSNASLKYCTSSSTSENPLSPFSRKLHSLQKLISSEPDGFLRNGERARKQDLTLPVFAVSASVSFQEFFSASGFCSSAVLLCCCDFPVSLLYVEELLSCLLEDIYFSVLARYRVGVYFIKRLQHSTAPSH